MSTQEIEASRALADDFVEMLAKRKWPATGIDALFLAEAMISAGASMLVARGRGAEAAERLRDLADDLERRRVKSC